MKTINVTIQVRGPDEKIDEMVRDILKDREQMMAQAPQSDMKVLKLDQVSDYTFEVELETT